MSVEVFKPLRWPIEIDASNDTITLNMPSLGPAIYTGTMAHGIYTIDGLDDSTDLVKLWRDEAQAILLASATGADIPTFNMLVDGGIAARATGTTVAIVWNGVNSLPSSTFGYTGTKTTLTTTTLLSDFQADLQWLSAVCEAYDSDNLNRDIVTERRNLRGRPVRLSQGDEDWLERVIDWRRVAAARLKDSRAGEADYADMAGVATGENNTWEQMWRYLKGNPGPYGDSRVYIYSDNDPATAVREGPYEVILDKSSPGLQGVGAEAFRQDESAEYFDVKTYFWRDQLS